MTADERLKAGICVITGCGKVAFCKSAWCGKHAIGANSKHRPNLDIGPRDCMCGERARSRPNTYRAQSRQLVAEWEASGVPMPLPIRLLKSYVDAERDDA
jgi:hypothetical protein